MNISGQPDTARTMPARCSGRSATTASASWTAQSCPRALPAGARLLGRARLRDRRATAATNALDHQADIAKVQEWLGHANIATRRIYDHRRTRPEDSPTFKVSY